MRLENKTPLGFRWPKVPKVKSIRYQLFLQSEKYLQLFKILKSTDKQIVRDSHADSVYSTPYSN